MQEKVTYYIGAGASINAIPAYDSFTTTFVTFLEQLSIAFRALYGQDDIVEVDRVINYLVQDIRKKNPLSIDVYARSLHHKEPDSIVYYHLKLLLSLYIITEQLRVSSTAANFNLIDKKPAFDNRYTKFLTNVIDRNKRVSHNINFISWNYDNQFELAYSQIYDTQLLYSQKMLQVFPSPESLDIDENFSRIIKLNGASGFYFSEDDRAANLIDLAMEEFNEHTLPIFFQVLKQNIHRVRNLNPALYFAWDTENKYRELAISYAKDIMENTTQLIVVGYSFPDFNRTIDTEIFGSCDSLHTVHLQVLEKDFEEVKENLSYVNSEIADAAKLHKHVGAFRYSV